MLNIKEQFADDIAYIREKHGEQKRINGSPYYLHPVAVAEIAAGFGVNDREIILVALCHDLLEDTNVTYEQLVMRYGVRVADLVVEVTKPPKDPSDNRSKLERSKEIYAKLQSASKDAQFIKVCDRIHNLREMHLAREKFRKQYILDTELLIENLQGAPFLQELKDAFDKSR